MDFVEDVYQSFCGNFIQPIRGAESVYYPGSKCEAYWDIVVCAYDRLRQRLSVEDEDEDVEDIITAFLGIQHEIAIKMFEFGNGNEKAL